MREQFNGIVWRFRTGSGWSDVPERYGSWSTLYDRFNAWSVGKVRAGCHLRRQRHSARGVTQTRWIDSRRRRGASSGERHDDRRRASGDEIQDSLTCHSTSARTTSRRFPAHAIRQEAPRGALVALSHRRASCGNCLLRTVATGKRLEPGRGVTMAGALVSPVGVRSVEGRDHEGRMADVSRRPHSDWSSGGRQRRLRLLVPAFTTGCADHRVRSLNGACGRL